jgi:hypothetical protein
MTPLGAEFLVNSSAANVQYTPRVDAATDGRLVVVWQDRNGTDDDVRARLLPTSNYECLLPSPFRAVAGILPTALGGGFRPPTYTSSSSSLVDGQTVLGPIDHILVTFSEPVLDSSFTTADVLTLASPGGSITPSS